MATQPAAMASRFGSVLRRNGSTAETFIWLGSFHVVVQKGRHGRVAIGAMREMLTGTKEVLGVLKFSFPLAYR